MNPITKDELVALADRAVGAGQLQLGSILSSISVMVENNDPKVLHEFAHHCAEHAVAGRQTHGRMMLEAEAAAKAPVQKERGGPVNVDQKGVQEETVERAINDKVAIRTPVGFVNGTLVEKFQKNNRTRYSVRLNTGDVVETGALYVPR